MRSRLLASTGALVLTLGGLLATAGPAAATDPAHCSGWSHGDYYHAGGIHFANGGTNIRSGPYKDCTALGDGYPSQGIDVHCSVPNSTGTIWVHLTDTTTGISGWSAYSALDTSGADTIPGCPQ